ncbi:hypothetical protein [Streptomyces misionensis]|uniref:hypothetical protein n=1 Tax=Streptomyces misionensis TaxID=67331 RepID=UPI00396BA12E
MTTSPLGLGDVIHGFAYGAFGRDHYHCVRIEAIGPDWIVARPDPNHPEAEYHGISFVAGRRSLELCIQARDEPCPTEGGCTFNAEPPLTTYESPR